jgi:hypothetical protein
MDLIALARGERQRAECRDSDAHRVANAKPSAALPRSAIRENIEVDGSVLVDVSVDSDDNVDVDVNLNAN